MNLLPALLLGLAATVTLAACAGETSAPDVEANESNITVPAEVLGAIANGQTKTGSYTGAPQNRAYTFRATGNDTITVDVGITDGDAVAFLTDGSFNVLAQDDNSGPGSDARVTFTVPPGPSRPFRIAFRNSRAPSGAFKVGLKVEAGACTGEEPWFDYQGKPKECESIVIDCAPSQPQFTNACGCGCELAP